MDKNTGILQGKLKQGWVFENESHGESFNSNILLIERLSGVVDEIPLIASDRVLESWNFTHSKVIVKGQFRSRNKSIEGKSTLQLYFFITEILPVGSVEEVNKLELEGYICKEPVYRLTPFNREICDLLIAVNRGVRRTDYIPCIAWGRNANWLKRQPIGMRLQLEGRIQSRKFTKQGDIEPNTRTAYEVSISKVSSASRD